MNAARRPMVTVLQCDELPAAVGHPAELVAVVASSGGAVFVVHSSGFELRCERVQGEVA